MVGKWLVCILSPEWMMAFYQTCTSILLRHEKELIRFWWPWPYFRSQEGSDCWKMACLHPISRMNGWILTKLVHLYCCDMETSDKILVTLTPLSRSNKDVDCWKMACRHPISWRNKWILTKLPKLYCCDMKKNWLDFDDLDPILKVTGGFRLLKNGFSAPYLQNEWMYFDQTCTATLLRQVQELIRFWLPWPHFQGHRGSDCWKMACLQPTSRMKEWILTKLVHLYCCNMEKDWLDFGDLDPIFNVTQGIRSLKNGLSAPDLMKE